MVGLICCCLSGDRKTMYLTKDWRVIPLAWCVCCRQPTKRSHGTSHLKWSGSAEIGCEIWCLLGSIGKRCGERKALLIAENYQPFFMSKTKYVKMIRLNFRSVNFLINLMKAQDFSSVFFFFFSFLMKALDED